MPIGDCLRPQAGRSLRKGEVVGTMPNAELPKALLNLVAAEFGGQERDQEEELNEICRGCSCI